MKDKSRFYSVGAVSLFILSASLSNAQDKIRTVEKGRSYPNSPVEVVSRELGDKSFMDDTRVLGDKDWLKHLKLSIKNVSSKNIISFNIDLLIKKRGMVLMGIPIYFRTYTQLTPNNVLTPEGEKKIGVLRPGEVVKVSVTDHVIVAFGDELGKRGIEDIDSVTLDIQGVYFEDETRWMYGQESRPDPKNPGKRIRIDEPELKPGLSQVNAFPNG